MAKSSRINTDGRAQRAAGSPSSDRRDPGQVGQQPRRLGEQHAVAPPAGRVTERLGDHGLPHPDGAVQDDRLAGLDEPQCGQVPDLGGRDLGVFCRVPGNAALGG